MNEFLNVNNIFKIEKDVLGPYERVGVWFQGCSLGCKGCIVPELWAFKPKKLYKAEELFKEITKYNLKEITISGGEPFQQPRNEFLKFLKILRENDFGIWVYSGYTIEELIKMEFIEHLKLIDVIVDGRYVEKLNNNDIWRGSSNQRIILLTDRYNNVSVKSKGRIIQIIIKKNEFYIIGIPPLKFYTLLRCKMKEKFI